MSDLDINQQFYEDQARADGYRVLGEPIDTTVPIRVVGVKDHGLDAQGNPVQELYGYTAQAQHGDFAIPSRTVVLIAATAGLVIPPPAPEPPADPDPGAEESGDPDPTPTPTPNPS